MVHRSQKGVGDRDDGLLMATAYGHGGAEDGGSGSPGLGIPGIMIAQSGRS
jgi:hypothetical protein